VENFSQIQNKAHPTLIKLIAALESSTHIRQADKMDEVFRAETIMVFSI